MIKTESTEVKQSQRTHISLFWQILLATLLVSIIPLALVSYTSFSAISETGETASKVAESELDSKSIDALRVRAEQTAVQITGFLEERVDDTLYAAELPPSLLDFNAFYDSKESEIWFLRESKDASSVERVRRSMPIYREIAVVDASGLELMRVVDGVWVAEEQLRNVADPAETSFLTETYFTETRDLPRGEVYVSPVMSWYALEDAQPAEAVDAETSQYEYINYETVIRFSAPRFNAAGEFDGIVVLTLDHRHIMEFSNHIQSASERVIWPSYTTGNYAYLLDYQGWLIAHPNLTALRGLGADGTLKPTQTKAGLEEGLSLPLNMLESDIKEQALIIANAVLSGESGSVQARNLEGAVKVDVYVPIKFSEGVYAEDGYFGGLVISENLQNVEKAGEISRDAISDSTSLLRGNIVWIAGVSMVVLVAVAIILSRDISFPIRRLTEAARVMEKGELDVDTLDNLLDQRIENEVSQLARVFKQMAEAVQLRERRLKEEVKELRIQIDRVKREDEVKKIVETEFFEDLQSKARLLRQQRKARRSG
jgi:hypothetical protein